MIIEFVLLLYSEGSGINHYIIFTPMLRKEKRKRHEYKRKDSNVDGNHQTGKKEMFLRF
jgi:hypothetical protein